MSMEVPHIDSKTNMFVLLFYPPPVYQANLDEQQASSNAFVRSLMTSMCQAAVICKLCNESLFWGILLFTNILDTSDHLCLYVMYLSSCDQVKPHIKLMLKKFPRGPSFSSATSRTRRRNCRHCTHYRVSWCRWNSHQVSVSLCSWCKCS